MAVSTWLAIAVLLSCCSLLEAGPTCYSCTGITNPDHCYTERVCADGMHCYIERRVNSGLHEVYDLGCETTQVCSRLEGSASSLIGKRNVLPTLRRRGKRDVAICSRCCVGNNCNRDLCRTDTAGSGELPATQTAYVRLVGGPNAYEGTVEVYNNGVWGAICDDSWSGDDAGVVCKMLGYSDVGAAGISGGLYQPSQSGRYWLDEVRCTGHETNIAQCPKNAWGVHDCGSTENAGVMCNPVSPQNDIIYLVDTGFGGLILRMNLLTGSYVPIPIDTYHATTFDYDPVEGRLYFYDPTIQEILSVHFDGRDVRELRQLPDTASVEKLEVDPLNRKLFYTDANLNTIESMNLDGSGHQVLINTDLDKVREIVLDPRTRRMYWSDWGANPKIESANYDGSDRRTLANTGLQWPNGIAIDYDENLMYFVDAGTDKIEVMGLDGSNRHVIFSDPNSHPFSVDVFGNYLYYTDWKRDTLMRINKDGTGQTSVGPGGFQRLTDLRVHRYNAELPGVTTVSPILVEKDHVFVRIHPDSLTQGQVTRGFVEIYANGQWGTICDDHWDDRDAAVICRMVGMDANGAQAIGESQAGSGRADIILLDEVHCNGNEEHIVDCGITQADWGRHDCSHAEDAGVQCTLNNNEGNFLIFGSGGLLNLMSTNTYSYTVIPIPGTSPNPIAIDYDPNTRTIYYTDVQQDSSTIYSIGINGQNVKVIKHLAAGAVADGLALDLVHGKLFYTDTGHDVIVSMNLDGTGQHTIINSGLDEPRAIVLDPERQVMYWTDWGSSPKIERSNYDGSNRQTLASTNLNLPNGLHLDQSSGKLYFLDAGTHRIESMNTDGSNRQLIFQDNGAHFFDLHITEEYIYYSDWRRHGVLRINKDGTSEMMAGPQSFGRVSGIVGYP